MPIHIEPMLAAGWGEIIIPAIILISYIVSWVNKQAKKQEDQQGLARRARELQAQRPGENEVSSADELAARRRRQLQELARQRTGADAELPGQGERSILRVDTPEQARPTNLEPGEIGQRAAARTAYEQRAAALRQQRTQAELARQQRRAAFNQKTGGGPPSVPVQPRPLPAPKPVFTIEQEEQAEEEKSVRIVADMPSALAMRPAAPVSRAARKGKVRINHSAIRQAVIWREILDPPLALREEAGV